MKETSEKLRDQAIETVMPLVDKMENAGLPREKIIDVAKKMIQAKINTTLQEMNAPESIGSILGRCFGPADSKPEIEFYKDLQQLDANLDFQYKIGPYRVDFLLWKYLIIELDGKAHSLRKEQDEIRDNYLRKMGYKVLRVPFWVYAIDKQAVIDEIKVAMERVVKNDAHK